MVVGKMRYFMNKFTHKIFEFRAKKGFVADLPQAQAKTRSAQASSFLFIFLCDLPLMIFLHHHPVSSHVERRLPW